MPHIEVKVWTGDGQWPRCYYVTEQLCGEKTICDCPSCPVRVAAKQAVFEQRQREAG
jgi:hypothetical protein